MKHWTEADNKKFSDMFYARAPRRKFNTMFPGLTEGQYRGRLVRLQLHRAPDPSRVRGLAVDHTAIITGRTLFPGRVRRAQDAPSLLAPGAWQKKLGGMVTRGKLSGYPIYSLTLEERATCPRTCHHWQSCMGNSMQWAWRHKPGAELELRLETDLIYLQRQHPKGFLVRLHILGDFYSVEYVNRWAGWLARFPALHVFGYTAWPRETPIGGAVATLARRQWDRFAIRLSATEPGSEHAITLWEWSDDERKTQAARGVIVCPVETHQTRDCGSCGLCWADTTRSRTIGFIAHGK